jgi:hypothetical protein
VSADRPHEDELLAAYLDGVSELTPDERRRVEARLAEDPALRDDADATRALLGQLRELPPEGAEPDWRAMEQAIRAEVSEAAPPRPWWKRWTWLVPAGALAMAAAIVALVLRAPEHAEPVAPDAGVARAAPPEPAAEEDGTVALWLDGAPLEIDVADVDLISEDVLDEDRGDGDDNDASDAADPEALTADLMAPGADLMAPGDLAWVDELGEDDIAAAEAWLARKKS